MKRSALSRYRSNFIKSVYAAIKECSRATGVTDLETVYQHLTKSAPFSLKRLKAFLADEQVRIIIQKCFKRCTVSAQDAAEQAAREAAQTEFDFFEMEQFRGVRPRITYRSEKKMEYVEYDRCYEWQRLLSIANLDTGIGADIARRDAEIAANKFLQPLVKKYGDLPAKELARLWLRDQEGGMAAGGVQ